jgi:hypothetical protein
VGGLSITGYVLDPVRVGAANSPYTQTPDIYISDQAAFDVAYPSDESEPRTDYLVFVLNDGDFPDAEFCWTKNEILDRFDYDGREQRFRTMLGADREELGNLGPDSNTTRFTVAIPISTDLTSYPVRVGVGSVPVGGTTFTVSLVLFDTDLNNPDPPAGTVQISQESGKLGWAPADLSSYNGDPVWFQQQTFFDLTENSGLMGVIGTDLFLNPLPATGQFPLIRIGSRGYLETSEVLVFVGPASGVVEWKRDTGELNFNATDITTYAGESVYYDGVVMEFGLLVTRNDTGTISAPGTVPLTTPEESDLFFQATGLPDPPVDGGTVQFPQTVWVDAFSTNGKSGTVEVRRSDGQIQFSLADQASYGTGLAWYIVPDLKIERGMTLRMFRTPVDLEGADPDLKDATALYATENATWADPMIGVPSVTLPALPRQDQLLTVDVVQGTGTFVGTLPDLDVVTPPTGYGYILDPDERRLQYARRREDIVVERHLSFGSAQLPDPLIFESGLVLELEQTPGSGVYTWSDPGAVPPQSPLVQGEDVLFDYTAALLTFVETDGTQVMTGDTGATDGFNGTVFTNFNDSFTDYPVLPGDLLIVTSGAAAGIYTVQTVTDNVLTVDVSGGVETNLAFIVRRGYEVLVDRFFQAVPQVDPNTRVERVLSKGTVTNAPRLSIDLAFIDDYRFWFDRTDFSTSVTKVANDAAFTPPASLGEFDVEISEDTGNLNFGQDAVTQGYALYSMQTLTLGTDYQLQPPLGFIEFTRRMLESEETYLTYAIIDENDDKQTVEERGVFLVRKELTADHPTPTSTLSFNPLGREVADNPAPQAFRGGRPQVTGEQVLFDTTASTVTFLSDDQVTDALPHGATVGPTENVYIDYYVYGAIGGEKTLTVIQPPMVSILVSIEEETTEFTIGGDRTATFKANHLLKVDRSEIYLIGSSAYDSGTELTTVTLASLQAFRSDFTSPPLDVTSGAVRTTGIFFFPSYFITELSTWDTPPRGASRVYINSDVSREYTSGTILLFTDNITYQDFAEVTGSTYDETTGKTEVVLLANNPRQYDSGTVTLKRSVRVILPSPTAEATTSRPPLLDEHYLAYRRTEGLAGQVLSEPAEFVIDEAGRVTFADPLQEDEELGVLYTGATTIEAGRRIRASYTHSVVPTVGNGMEGQILQADYTTYLPDSSYWRVETFTNFRAELAEQYEDDAKASIPSGGPRLENISQLQLYEQGRESIWFQEGRLANEDLVARPTLKYYNDAINYLEDALQDMDGRVIGGHEGRFLFDGLIDNPDRSVWADVTNQIDDRFKISDAPVTISFPPFSVTFLGTWLEVYKASDYSRFYPAKRNLFSVTAPPTGLVTGDTILDAGTTNLRAVNLVSRRLPWAIVTQRAAAGSTILQVDSATGADELLRPPFDDVAYPAMPVVIQDRDGTWLLPTAGPGAAATLDIASVTATSITLTGPLPAAVPVGATIYHIPFYSALTPEPPTPYLKNYRVGFDVGVNLQEGLLTHITPFPPYDGTNPLVPAPLEIQNPGGGEVLDVFAATNVSGTSPDRFPVLDGGVVDDDNNRSFPMLSPDPVQEVDYLLKEVSAIGNTVAATTPSLLSTGDLDATRTIITNNIPGWPAPTPKGFDVVEIRTGLNGPSGYYRIVSVNVGGTLTVATPFPLQDTGFEFAVSVSASLVSSSGTVSPATRLTDGGTNFIAAGVQPGHTVVFTGGALTGERRQVTAVVSPTQLDIDAAPATGAVLYNVDDSLLTFGGTGSLVDDDLIPALDGELAVLSTNTPPTDPWAEVEALERFLDHVMTDVLTSTQGQTSTGSPVLTDTTVDFTGLTSANFVYIRTGTSAGIYQVDTVTSPTTLDIVGTFPDSGAGISYRIVETLGAGFLTLEGVYRVLSEVDQALLDVTAFRTLVTTLVSVVGDSGAYAVRVVTTDLLARLNEITIRRDQLINADPAIGSIVALEVALASGDRWYDKRYTWIDTRINLETGILVKKDRAVENRIKAQMEALMQLIKLLTVSL